MRSSVSSHAVEPRAYGARAREQVRCPRTRVCARIGKGRGRCFEVGEHVEHVHVRSAPPPRGARPSRSVQARRPNAPQRPRETAQLGESPARVRSASTALPQRFHGPFHALSTRCPRAWETCVMCSYSCVLDRELHACDPLCHKAFERCSCARSCAWSTCARVLSAS